jgi:hypothetical protein
MYKLTADFTDPHSQFARAMIFSTRNSLRKLFVGDNQAELLLNLLSVKYSLTKSILATRTATHLVTTTSTSTLAHSPSRSRRYASGFR